MSDWLWDVMEKFMIFLVALSVVLVGFLIWWLIAMKMHATEGVVVDKYYDDPDWVCAKACTRHPECWTIVTDDVWYANSLCYDKADYDKINVGDHIKEN